MSRKTRARVILAAVAVVLAVAPPHALAQRMGGGARAGSSGSFHRGFHRGSPGGRGFVHRPFGGIVVFAPPLWYGSDIFYDPSPGYGLAPAYGPVPTYGPVVGGTLAPPSSPAPTVVQHPTGRWELRGDGLTIPYRWVWIPNPPAAPPPPAGEPMTPAPPASSPPERPGNTRIYRWTDGQGVLHLTDRLETIPERYRSQARSGRPS